MLSPPAGTTAAAERLRAFIAQGLKVWAPAQRSLLQRTVRELSPWLHFGQIAPSGWPWRRSAVSIRHPARRFWRELIVRRELSVRFCLHSTGL